MTSDVGFTCALRLFQLAVADADWTPERAGEALGMSGESVERAIEELMGLGLLTKSSGVASGRVAAAPEAALSRLLAGEMDALSKRREELDFLQGAVGFLASEMLTRHARQRELIQTDLVLGAEAIAAALQDATAIARTEIVGMHPGPVLSQQLLAEGLSRNQDVLSRGVAMRSIHLDAMRRIPYALAHLEHLGNQGIGVRLAHALPFRLIVVDDTMAFTSVPTVDGTVAALVTYSSTMADLLRRVFEYCWVLALPLVFDDAIDEVPIEGPTGQQRYILRMMAAGFKDDAVARELGISVRTLRRTVSALMARTGAASRFQLGVSARDRLWLD